MPRRERLDEPGAWHHVMNRGIAKRTLFEGREDIRFFLSRLAWAVRSGAIEVHAFSILATHFHLLVRSPRGVLSEVMHQVQLAYVRRFNRLRRRDGPLVRGRFRSKPVLSWVYRTTLVRYIDRNPVRAGLCRAPADYPFGSAACYARKTGPPWLERSWVEQAVREASGGREYEPAAYARWFGTGTEADDSLVERRVEMRGPDVLDDLVGSTPDRILAWMHWKARLADGTEPGLCLVAPAAVDSAVDRARAAGVDLLLVRGRSDGLREVHAGLLQHLCGQALAEIAERIGRSVSTCSELCRRHEKRLHEDEAYASHATRLAHAAIQAQHGSPILAARTASDHRDGKDSSIDVGT
jgi:REP element-mobilizing transposase RayT